MNVACDYEAPMQMFTTEKYIASRPETNIPTLYIGILVSGPGPPIGPWWGSGGKPLTWVQGAPLCRKICIWWGRIHNFRPLSSLDLQVYI